MNLTLKAEIRKSLGRQTNELRRKGWLPAVVYGKGTELKVLQVEYNPFVKILRQAGYSGLVDLEITSEPVIKVLIQDIQKDPVSDRIIHADFHEVNLKEKIEARIAVKFVGEAPAVKELKGILVRNISQIDVKSLPQDLVPEIEIDISSLKKFGDVIQIKDIKLPKGIEVLENLDEVAATVTEFVEEKEVAPVTEAEAVAGVGVIEKKKAEEGEEGAAVEGAAKPEKGAAKPANAAGESAKGKK